MSETFEQRTAEQMLEHNKPCIWPPHPRALWLSARFEVPWRNGPVPLAMLDLEPQSSAARLKLLRPEHVAGEYPPIS